MDRHFSEPITSCNGSGDNGHTFLCEVCKGLGDCNPHSQMLGRRHKGTYVHHRNLVTLKSSAQSGCQMCQLLFDCLKEDQSFDTVFAEAQELELRRASLLSSGLGFDWKRDTDEAAEIARSVAQKHESEQHEKTTKLKTRIARLGRVAKAMCKGGGYDEVKTETNIQGRIVIRFEERELRDKPCFQDIEVRVSGSYLPAIHDPAGIWRGLEVFVSTGRYPMAAF